MDLDFNIWQDDDESAVWHIASYPMRQNAEGLWETDALTWHEHWEVTVADIANTPALLCFDWWVSTAEHDDYTLILPLIERLRAA